MAQRPSPYALTDFEVKYWTGTAWAIIPGASITANDKVWRKLTFSPVVTTKILLNVTTVAGDNHTQVVEIEAYSRAASASLQWLVTDQLGTPRMIFDQSGSLANMKRHDYLPFGEELFPGVGGRSTTQGYTADGIRQQFTSKERDIETGLDYFGARYFASTQGRFTSPDPFSIIQLRQRASNDEKTRSAFMQFIGDPRRWNRFAYAINSPLVFTDKTGLDIMVIENHATGGRPGHSSDSNPMGHTAIAISGRGVYSMGNADKELQRDSKNNILGGSVKDYLERELPRRDTTIIIIKTTPEQDAAAAQKLEEIASSRAQLTVSGILSDNCSVRVNEALDAAGVPKAPGIVNPAGPSVYPAPTNLPGDAGSRAMQVGNDPQKIEIPKNSSLPQSTLEAIKQFEPKKREN
ncbi:MAG TPA: RHS repeat-associated core domain-containing protein [Pyrinomonadaceae bacterium]